MVSRRIYVVDDDEQVRLSLGFLLRTAGFTPHLFESGTLFLKEQGDLDPGCILLDIRMPGIDGMDVLECLIDQGSLWPIIMMTGHGDVPLAVRAIKQGAFDFLEKPFNDGQLIDLLEKAFKGLEANAVEVERRHEAKAKIDTLTKRERDVLQGLVDGLNNKGVARRFEIGTRTIEMHRSNMMSKLGASSVAEALQMATMAGMKPSS